MKSLAEPGEKSNIILSLSILVEISIRNSIKDVVLEKLNTLPLKIVVISFVPSKDIHIPSGTRGSP